MGTETPLYSGSSSILGSKQVKKNNPLMGTETFHYGIRLRHHHARQC